jgi:amino acid transporter
MWLNTTVQVSQIGLITTTYLTYAFGPKLDWLATNPLALASTSVLLILGMMIIARLGLGVGKWLSNAGSFFTVLILVVLAAIPFFRAARATYAYHPLPLIHPPLTLFTFSVFSKMTFGALTGFELVAIFAGESRNPARNLARSILFTAPLIALLYILGTSSILAYVSPDSIDVIGPIPQALSLALPGFAFARFLVPAVILLLLTNYLSSYTLYFSTNTRLPLVAGWDQLLPRWFSVLHPKYRTPVNSILFVGAVALVASIAASVGAGNQEAFVLLQIWSWTFYGLAYLAMFAIPLFGKRMFTEERLSDQSFSDARTNRPRAWLRLLALSGFLITLLFVALSIFPIVDVTSRFAYSMKIVLVVLGANLIGWLVYRAGSATAQPPSGERVQPTA